MRAAEGLVRVVVHHVGAEIARPGDAQDGVHVRPVEIDQPAVRRGPYRQSARIMRLEDAQRVGVGDHEHGRVVVELRRQIVQVDQAVDVRLDGHRLEAGHRGAGRVGAVAHCRGSAPWCRFRPGRENRPPPPAGPSIRRAPRRPVAANTAGSPAISCKHLLQLVEHLQHALDRLLRLVGMQVGQARQRRQPLVPLGVVLHRARPERIEMRVDRHVERRQIDEMPHHLRFGQLRQGRRGGGQRAGRQQLIGRTAARRTRQPRRAAPGLESSNRSSVSFVFRIDVSVQIRRAVSRFESFVGFGCSSGPTRQRQAYINTSNSRSISVSGPFLGDRHQEAIGQFRIPLPQRHAGQKAGRAAVCQQLDRLGRHGRG